MTDNATITNLHILIAEDSPCIQRVLSYTVESCGARVTVVENGRDAVEQAMAHREASIDAVLMDMQMPILDGYAATRELRSLGFTRPVIALTADDSLDGRRKCLDAGCDFFATKPIDRDELVDLVASACGIGERIGGDSTQSHASAGDVGETDRGQSEGPYRFFDVSAAMKRLGGDAAFLAEMAATFIHFQRQQLSEITTAIADSNAPELRRVAHGLKGALADFTSAAPYHTAMELEAAGQAGDLSDADSLAQQLELQVRQLCDELQQYCAASQDGPALGQTGSERLPLNI